jgi:hypothetical protein
MPALTNPPGVVPRVQFCPFAAERQLPRPPAAAGEAGEGRGGRRCQGRHPHKEGAPGAAGDWAVGTREGTALCRPCMRVFKGVSEGVPKGVSKGVSKGVPKGAPKGACGSLGA